VFVTGFFILIASLFLRNLGLLRKYRKSQKNPETSRTGASSVFEYQVSRRREGSRSRAAERIRRDFGGGNVEDGRWGRVWK
jgi:hypothetical protein